MAHRAQKKVSRCIIAVLCRGCVSDDSGSVLCAETDFETTESVDMCATSSARLAVQTPLALAVVLDSLYSYTSGMRYALQAFSG